MADIIYNDYLEELHKGNIDLVNDVFRAILLTDSYTPDATDHDYDDISANEVANGSGYTTGGKTITQSFAEVAGVATFDASDLSWALASFTCRYLVIFDDSHADDLLVCCLDMLANKTGLGDKFNARFNASGIIYGQQA